MEQQWRRQLLSYARGQILEVGVGTGINFNYYPLGVSVTATDTSARVMERAKEAALVKGVKTKFIVSPVEDLRLSPRSFDTIVSTLTLSAFERPVRVMERLNEWCREDGMILLMEYGLSKHKIVRSIQKICNPYYYKATGSHLDRDMLALLNESRFNVKRVEMKYAGVVHLVWASPGTMTNEASSSHVQLIYG